MKTFYRVKSKYGMTIQLNINSIEFYRERELGVLELSLQSGKLIDIEIKDNKTFFKELMNLTDSEAILKG